MGHAYDAGPFANDRAHVTTNTGETSTEGVGRPTPTASTGAGDDLGRELERITADRVDERRRLTDQVIRIQAELNAHGRHRVRLLQRREEIAAQHATEVDELTDRIITLRYHRDLARWRLETMERRRWTRLGEAVRGFRRGPAGFPRALRQVLRVLAGGTPAPRLAKPDPPPVRELAAPHDTDVPAVTRPDEPKPPIRRIAAATALDPIAERQLSFEWVGQPVTATTWRTVLEDAAPDLLLIDVAGWDRLAVDAPSEDGREELVRAFGGTGVPTIFWDTGIASSSTVDTARAQLFDRIVCSSEATADAYRTAGCTDVAVFAPAAQFRDVPPGGGQRPLGVLALPSLAAPTADGPLCRAGRSVSPRAPERPDDGRRPPGTERPSADVVREHKLAVVELSTGTDADEIREVMETVATRTLVLAGGPVPPELSDVLFVASTPEEARDAMKTLLASDELRDRLAQRAWRRLRRDHALTDRVDELLSGVGLAGSRPVPRVTMMVPTNRPHKLETVLDNLGRQTYPALSVKLVLHGVDVDAARVTDLAAERGLDDISILRVPGDVALGEVFNRGFADCDGDLVGKMDDDDHYGADYTSDLVADIDATSADIVGKWAHYAYSEALDATMLRYPEGEHTYTSLLAISTLLLRPEVLDQVSFLPMEKGSGSQFLREAGSLGARVYAGNRFNYLYNRYSSDGHTHTWPVAEYEFASRSRFVCQGQNLAAVDA